MWEEPGRQDYERQLNTGRRKEKAIQATNFHRTWLLQHSEAQWAEKTPLKG